MGILSHAEIELEKIGALEDWPIYKPFLELFCSQGHGGGSASIVIPTLNKLLKQEALSELTSDEAEWEDLTEMSGHPCWQNKRDSRAFSKDEGKTWVFLEDEKWDSYWK